MTAEQSAIIKQSFPRVLARMLGNAQILYDKLFELAPETKELFKNTSMERQSQMLVAAIGKLVRSIDNWENLKPDIEALAKRHAGYGLKPEHFVFFGIAFLHMLKSIYENEWNSSLEDAWKAIYQRISEVMVSTLFQQN